MGIRLGLRVRVMARAWVVVMVRVLFYSSIAQFVAILCIPHSADADWVWS